MNSANYDNTCMAVLRPNPGTGANGKAKPNITFKGDSNGFSIDISLWKNDKAQEGEKLYTGKLNVTLPNGDKFEISGQSDIDFDNL
jgi:hypothetical protein